MQAETPLLISRLLDAGRRVLLETNGSIDIHAVDARCVRIVDIKSPSSGMSRHNYLRNLKKLRSHDELKFVIADRKDYEFARDLLSTSRPACARSISPYRLYRPPLPGGVDSRRSPSSPAQHPASQGNLGTGYQVRVILEFKNYEHNSQFTSLSNP